VPRSLSRESAERKEEKAGGRRNASFFYLFICWQFRPFIVQHYQIVKKKHWVIIQTRIVVLTQKKNNCFCLFLLKIEKLLIEKEGKVIK